MNWDDKAYEYAEARSSEYFGHLPEQMFEHGAKWQRDQLRTDEAIERVARELNGGGRVCMRCEYEPYDFDKCESCRNVCVKQARRAITALLGDN